MIGATEAGARAATLLAAYERGWSLPQPFYTDPEFFALDVEHVFARNWLFVAHDCEVPEPGDWLRVDVAGDSVLVVRGADGVVRAMFNTCRHRGSLICLTERGQSRRLTCPYHHWSYDLDGSFARGRFLAEDFDRDAHGLIQVPCEIVGGYVFIWLGGEPDDFAPFAAAAAPFLAPHGLDRVKVAHSQTIVEACNWKLVMENNRECYHCAAAHPELMFVIDEFDGPGSQRDDRFEVTLAERQRVWERDGFVHEQTEAGGLAWRLVRIPFTNDAVAMTVDGSPASQRTLGRIRDDQRELGSVRMLHLPNTWNHVQSDHVVSFSVIPISATETRLTTRWLVHDEAVEGVDYDLRRLTEVWVATNHQDRTLAENNQLGIASRGYRPGPYAPLIEAGTADFTQWYVERLLASLQNT